jgi:formylglycine-generating enzyme required for sulfatase activity
MGQQVRFYAVHADFRALLCYAHEGGLLALPRVVDTAVYDRRGYVAGVPPLEFEGEGRTRYLVPRKVPVVEVFYHQFRGDPARSYLASRVSPVIELVPCRREGDELYHGRVYTDAPRQGPGSDLVYQAYRRLARHVRGWRKVAEGVYAGPVTIERLARGQVRLMVVGGRELQVEVEERPPAANGPRLEWLEIPAGKFTRGLTDEQRADVTQRLYDGYGIGELEPELRAWVETTLHKSKSDYSPEENEIWREEVLKGGSPTLAYQHAMWDLGRIPEARSRRLPTFYVARFPITRAQAGPFYASTAAQAMGWAPDRYHSSGDRPAVFSIWQEAQAMAHWLGGRLPTPLEWEKAARGTDGRLYPWGDAWNPGAGHFRTSEAHQGDAEKRQGRLTAVDAYPEGASPYGVMDLVGNLAEWHALNAENDVGMMGFSVKEMGRVNPWFYALPMHRRGATRRQGVWYVGCRPVLEVWGRRLWPGYRPELDVGRGDEGGG